MFRRRLKQGWSDAPFRARGTESTRIEGFSDGVFALAVTFLVLSSSVPETYAELLASLADLPAFAICITLLIRLWYAHFRFFDRFGLRDPTIVVMNTVLMFLILFYVYPLKFLFRLVVEITRSSVTATGLSWDYLFNTVLSGTDGTGLMMIFGAGLSAIFVTFMAMHVHVLALRAELELSDAEVSEVRAILWGYAVRLCVPALSIGAASLISPGTQGFLLSGMIYLLLIPMGIIGRRLRKRRLARPQPAVDA